MYFAFGVLAMVLAVFLALVLWRLTRTLAAVEDLVVTTTEEMRETLPDVRQTLGNVNDITSAINLGLRAVSAGAVSFSEQMRETLAEPAAAVKAAAHGVKVGTASLWRSHTGGSGDGKR
jgi:hypothetical protein